MASIGSGDVGHNRVTMYHARRYDPREVRDMRRTALTNEVSSLEQGPIV